MEEYIWSIQAAHKSHGGEEVSSEAGGDDLAGLTQQVDRLALACQALWEIVRENTDITEQDLAQKITEIDLRDGFEDGKMRTRPVECPSCGRKSNSRRTSCLWCGGKIDKEHAFES